MQINFIFNHFNYSLIIILFITMNNTLKNCRIIYTRSGAHFPSFQKNISALGGEAIHLPLLDTTTEKLTPENQLYLHHAHYLIFTSANAVRHLFSQYRPHNKQLPIAIGEKTAATLKRQYEKNNHLFQKIIIAPPPFNSESLLTILQPQGKKIAIIAAEGGRKALLKQLQKDNDVKEIFVYRRFNPSDHLTDAMQANLLSADVITIASKNTLSNLLAILPQSVLKLLQYQTCIAAISAAVARYAAQHGFRRSIFAQSAAESEQIDTICRWWNTN